jgi:hypothetical protein
VCDVEQNMYFVFNGNCNPVECNTLVYVIRPDGVANPNYSEYLNKETGPSSTVPVRLAHLLYLAAKVHIIPCGAIWLEM